MSGDTGSLTDRGTAMGVTIINPPGSANGTQDDDVFVINNFVEGLRSFDGLGGRDRFEMDRTQSGIGADIFVRSAAVPGSFQGEYSIWLVGETVEFFNMEDLDIVGTLGSDYMSINVNDSTVTRAVSFDGSLGNDRLYVDAVITGPLSFVVTDGLVASNIYSFTGFEQYGIGAGSGDDIITTGAGNDWLSGGAGINTLDGGAGDDSVSVANTAGFAQGGDGIDHFTAYSNSAESLTASIGNTLEVSGRTVAAGFERYTFSTGSGDDSITIRTSAIVYGVSGGAGFDRLTVDLSLLSLPPEIGEFISRVSLSTNGFEYPTPQLELWAYDQVFLDQIPVLRDFEQWSVVGTNGNDYFSVDTSVQSSSFFFDGNGGTDQFSVSYYRETGPLVIAIGADNVFHEYAASFANVEQYGISGSRGADRISTAGADISISGSDGNDQLSGGPGRDTLYGGRDDDLLNGGSGIDSLNGGDGNDTLVGGAGSDTMAGDLGNDRFYVDAAGDVVVEEADSGNDVVYTSVNYTLGALAVVETLSTANGAGTTPLVLVGNDLANVIYGNAGANSLFGQGGADTLVGFGGDDSYYVDVAGDLVSEAAGGGTDVIYASANYVLRPGTAVEVLSTSNGAGTTALNLTGNALANTVYGNDGANVLNGGGAADALAGFGGNDIYYVDTAGDLVGEAAGGGTDVVYASVSYALSPGSHVDTLSTSNGAGTAALNLTGNELANTLYGNAGANVLNGGGGADAMNGYGGADRFTFTTALGSGNIDRIGDFAPGSDKIVLGNAVFTGLVAGALAPGAFHVGAGAADAGDRIVYNPLTGALLFDADGLGGAVATAFATLRPNLALAATDFLVI